MSDGRYTEGVCGDGAAILRDGRPMRISEVLDVLNATERTPTMTSNDEWVRERAKRIANYHGGIHVSTVRFLEQNIAAFGQECIERGRQSVLARLEDPDEALVEKMATPHCENDWPCRMCRDNARTVCRALAATLTEEKKE